MYSCSMQDKMPSYFADNFFASVILPVKYFDNGSVLLELYAGGKP